MDVHSNYSTSTPALIGEWIVNGSATGPKLHSETTVVYGCPLAADSSQANTQK